MKSDVLKTIICRKIQQDGFITIAIDGNCMSPLICDKEVVMVTKNMRYKIGDIVLVYVSRSLRIHRIVRTINGMCITKGDHALFVDAIDQHEPEIIGLVTKNVTRHMNLYHVLFVSRLISYFSLFASTVRKRFGAKVDISFVDRNIKRLGCIELCYLERCQVKKIG